MVVSEVDADAGGEAVLKWKKYDGAVYVYAHYGEADNVQYRLWRIDYPSGQKIKFDYAPEYPVRMTRLYDPVSNRGADFIYNGDGMITEIVVGSDHLYYDIQGENQLVEVRRNANIYYSYLYGDSRFPGSITGVLDANDNFVEEISYYDDNRAMYTVTAEHSYFIEYSEAGATKLTDLNTGIATNVNYDTDTHRLLASDQCFGSCSFTGGGEYLYDGRNNRVISSTEDSITQSFYDSSNNQTGKVLLSSWNKVIDAGLVDEFNLPGVDALNWIIDPVTKPHGRWEMIPNHVLELKPHLGESRQNIFFTSKDRIRLLEDRDFMVRLKYNVPLANPTNLHLIIASAANPSQTWVELSANTTYFNYWWCASFAWGYAQKDIQVPAPNPSAWARPTSPYQPEGELVMRRIGHVIYLSGVDGLGTGEIPLFDTSVCGGCDFSEPMIIQFGSTAGEVGIDSITVTGASEDSVEHYNAVRVPGQLEETLVYYTKDTKLPPGTLVSVAKESLAGAGDKTTTYYDYDADIDATGFNHNPSRYLNRIIKRGFIADAPDGVLDHGETVYTCYKYENTTFPAKVTKEYQPSIAPGCTSSYTTYEYYAADDGDGHYKKGDLKNKCECASAGTCDCSAALIRTEYQAYDDMGNAIRVRDPNAIITEYEYDSLGHVTRQVVDADGGHYTTTYTYAGNQMTNTSSPAGSEIKYIYGVPPINPNGFLSNNLMDVLSGMQRFPFPGATEPLEGIKYIYGVNGSALFTETQYYQGAYTGSYDRKVVEEDGATVYKDVKRKYQKITEGAIGSGQSQVITLTIFDDAGNPLAKTVNPDGPDQQTTAYAYNVLNQLYQVIDPLFNVTTYAYDAHGNLASVTATNAGVNQVTTYTYDDFGRLIASNSPDAGQTFYLYDPRNNLVSKKDARSTTVNYTYDSMNRLTKIAFPNDPDIEYYYDGAAFTLPWGTSINPEDTNSKGRLTGVKIAETSGDVYPRYFTYQYDSRGNIINSTMGVWAGGHNPVLTTLYQYDADGNLSQMTYPEGRVVNYTPQTLDPTRVASVNTTVEGAPVSLVSNISYYPFGEVRSMEFGNGIAFNSYLDKRYFPQQITANNVLDLTYQVDGRGNITAIADGINSNRSQAFAYDLKDQLVSATGAYGAFSWSYDRLGNRLTQNAGAIANYSYYPGANRLESYDETGGESATSISQNTVTVYYAPGKMPHGRSLQAEWEQLLAEAHLILDEADQGKTSRRYNNLVGKFNQFINHSEFERKSPEKIINGNQNLNQLVQSFMERENWNGPRKDNPVTWTAWLRALARAILAEAEKIQFVQIEQATAVTQGESYEYDDAGSMSRSHKYEGGVESSVADYVNNDDSRLAAIEGANYMFGDYVHDHLGQRVLKSDLGTIIFVYDVFGNMIGEYYTDHSFRNEFIYLGGARLAMVSNISASDVGYEWWC